MSEKPGAVKPPSELPGEVRTVRRNLYWLNLNPRAVKRAGREGWLRTGPDLRPSGWMIRRAGADREMGSRGRARSQDRLGRVSDLKGMSQAPIADLSSITRGTRDRLRGASPMATESP
jgi:hypothetical protein